MYAVRTQNLVDTQTLVNSLRWYPKVFWMSNRKKKQKESKMRQKNVFWGACTQTLVKDFFLKKHEKSIFWPVFGAHSTQTPVEIYYVVNASNWNQLLAMTAWSCFKDNDSLKLLPKTMTALSCFQRQWQLEAASKSVQIRYHVSSTNFDTKPLWYKQ